MNRILLFFVLFISQIAYSQSDCSGALAVCGNTNISFTPSGAGTQETLGGCLSTEHYSVWYKFTIATSGTLTFEITPNGNADYDWAVYGPNVTCAAKGAPIRCSYDAPPPYATGLNMTSLDVSETAGLDNLGNPSDGMCKYLDVVAGQTYYLIVDNFSLNTNGFSLTWGGTATLASPFNDPVLAPNPFVSPGTANATPGQPSEITVCSLPMQYDLSTLTNGILNNNTNFIITYHYSTNDALTGTAPITAPITVNATTTYYYSIKYNDPVNPTNPINDCRTVGAFKFKQGNIVTTSDTLSACPNINGLGTFNLPTASIYGGAATYQYYTSLANLNAGTNAIPNPAAYVAGAGTVYVKTTTNDGCVNSSATITLVITPLITNNETLYGCNNNKTGVGLFNLTIANVYSGTGANTYTYYKTLADLNADTNAIANPTTYTSGEGSIYVKVTTPTGCVSRAPIITLKFNPVVNVTDAVLSSCFLELLPTKASFDLTIAPVTTDNTATKLYYPTLNDALASTNEIMTPDNYISEDGSIYIKVISTSTCYSIARVTLNVIKPKYSTVLKDKFICLEDRTTLDAGPGFASYLWSTGATTQSISGLTIGEYWVKLQTGTCYTIQKVNVKVGPLPLITNLDINNNTVTVNAAGGIPPYKYSINGTTWQDSNIFTNLPRGENTFYVKDTQDCNPFILEMTVPNLVNAITPNGDNVNDYVDYKELAYKENLNFQIYDRYGNKVFTGEKFNNYRWDGKHYDKKIITGTYWYTITWNENNKEKTPVKYSGWILVKNRE